MSFNVMQNNGEVAISITLDSFTITLPPGSSVCVGKNSAGAAVNPCPHSRALAYEKLLELEEEISCGVKIPLGGEPIEDDLLSSVLMLDDVMPYIIENRQILIFATQVKKLCDIGYRFEYELKKANYNTLYELLLRYAGREASYTVY